MEFGKRKCRQERELQRIFEGSEKEDWYCEFDFLIPWQFFISFLIFWRQLKGKPEVFAGNPWYPVVLRGSLKADFKFSPAVAGCHTWPLPVLHANKIVKEKCRVVFLLLLFFKSIEINYFILFNLALNPSSFTVFLKCLFRAMYF